MCLTIKKADHNMKILIKLIIFLFAQITIIFSLPDQGKFDLVINKVNNTFNMYFLFSPCLCTCNVECYHCTIIKYAFNF